MSAADLIAMGVDVMSQDDEICRRFPELHYLIEAIALDTSHASGVREIVAMLRDAADSAADVVDDPESATLARIRRFSKLMTVAIEELRE